jgi:hypothetical protein
MYQFSRWISSYLFSPWQSKLACSAHGLSKTLDFILPFLAMAEQVDLLCSWLIENVQIYDTNHHREYEIHPRLQFL